MTWKIISKNQDVDIYSFMFEDNEGNKVEAIWNKTRDTAEYKAIGNFSYSLRDMADIKSLLIPKLMEIIKDDKEK